MATVEAARAAPESAAEINRPWVVGIIGIIIREKRAKKQPREQSAGEITGAPPADRVGRRRDSPAVKRAVIVQHMIGIMIDHVVGETVSLRVGRAKVVGHPADVGIERVEQPGVGLPQIFHPAPARVSVVDVSVVVFQIFHLLSFTIL